MQANNFAWARTRSTGITTLALDNLALKQQLKDKRVEHQRYIKKYGQDMPEICDWRWGARRAAEGEAT